MQEHEALAVTLAKAAEHLAEAARTATMAHRNFVALCENDRSWMAAHDVATDEIRNRRVDVGLYAVGQLIEHLTAEAAQAEKRYPAIDSTGKRLPPTPPRDDPVALLNWWRDLSKADRKILTKHKTEWVGRADGLPVRARHEANLILLESEISWRSHLLAADDTMLEDISVHEQRDLRGLLKLRALLEDDPHTEGLQGIATPRQQRHLYLLDATEYPLKAAVVLGNVDTANYVIVHVPGATSTVDLRLFREATWMSNLRAEAGRLVGGQDKVAIIDWMGYQAPFDITSRRSLGDSGISVMVPGEAMDDKYARQAAPHLARCAEGIRALIGGTVRLVASGHSYGSSVLGLALQETAVFDAAMVTGSPGLFATEIGVFKLPQHALYASVAPGDIVGMLSIFGLQVTQLPGVQVLNPLPRATSYPDGSRALLLPPVGHESYYNPNTSSLHALAAIAVGDESRIKTMGRFANIRTVVGGGD